MGTFSTLIQNYTYGVKTFDLKSRKAYTHLNRDNIKSNLSVPGIQGCHENALCKSFETSPHLICLYASTNIPLGPA